MRASTGRRWLGGLVALLPLLAACSRPAPPPPGAFEPGQDFEPRIAPAELGALAYHPARGQTFEQFVQAKPSRPDGRRSRIYLQPLGEFPPGTGPSFQKLREYTKAFFQLDVVIRPPLGLPETSITSRRNPALGHKQLRSGDLLAFLSQRLPADAYAMLGFTSEDLYPEESWSFIFGQASLRTRVGVYSFARYDPSFHGEERPPDWQKILLRRTCKVLAHETSHLFGIRHCAFYHCLMNGSNFQDVCPIDLRKLHHSIGFDVIERYEDLRDFSEREGLEEEAAWFRRRIAHLDR